jgi:hypothetical protein
MNPIDEVLGAIRDRTGEDLPRYSQIFRKAADSVAPVHFRKEYDQFFWHCATTIPNWLPRVVAACASTESNGAHSLLDIWKKVNFHKEAEQGLLRHAKDEAGHARLFVKLASLAFEENFAPSSLEALRNSLIPLDKDEIAKSSNIIEERMLIDYLIQLNIVEIRTRHHLHLLAPMYYSLTPTPNKHKTEKILIGLQRDELSHITYTAKLIDDWMQDNDVEKYKSIYMCRLQNYNEHTLEHCDVAKFDYGQGRFPALFND